ncbi:GTP cyclohydrolase II [Blastocladiella emersonii ATCC 22665]|nr:GTP cyclohydrolase II [Blastocladiella emersonii ATCC 22665]
MAGMTSTTSTTKSTTAANGTSSAPAAALLAVPAGSAECLVRTRVPTRFGADVYVHLYRNTLDDKEHLALVFGPRFRSKTLDAARPGESDADRLTRGAAVAKPTTSGPGVHPRHASRTGDVATAAPATLGASVLPLVRLHSECYTGETISSVRCDCGDQLDEAMRLMALAGDGVIVYLRQEGRGIGLHEKLRAYNLQDQGFDTVAANLLLNHPADLRTYDVASLILRDLGVKQVRLLTNNPDKLEQITKVGIEVADRVGMVPAHWKDRAHRPHGLAHVLSGKSHAHFAPSAKKAARRAARKAAAETPAVPAPILTSTKSSGSVTSDAHSESDSGLPPTPPETAADVLALRGARDDVEDTGSSSDEDEYDEDLADAEAAPVFPEMEAYLRTKVERMRHIIDLSESPTPGATAAPARESATA